MNNQIPSTSESNKSLSKFPNIRRCDIDDAMKVTELVNEAFMKDAFFKHETHYLRMKEDGSTALRILKSNTSIFLCYEDQNINDMLGCVKVDINTNLNERNCQGPSDKQDYDDIYYGSFGMLSVQERNGGRGIGSQLLKAMEEYITNKAIEDAKTKVKISMPLISLRSDLLKFYEKRGYSLWKTTCLDDEDIEMVLPKYIDELKFLWHCKLIEI